MSANSSTASTRSFKDLHGDFWKEELTVRLIHSWEARNIKNGNILIGVEVLLIDSKAVAMQGFISANRLYRFQGKLKPGAIYRLSNFIIRPAKRVYRVTANALGCIFMDQTSFVEDEGSTFEVASQKFRIQNFQAFVDIADMGTNL